jgi:hypothetical protein
MNSFELQSWAGGQYALYTQLPARPKRLTAAFLRSRIISLTGSGG